MSALFWAFSKNVFTDVGVAWSRADVDKKPMFQKMLFPSGLQYSAEAGILNPDKSNLFSELKQVVGAFTTFGASTGFEPVLSA